MSFSAPLGLLALLALPAVLVLHLFRRRFRERRVAALFLFAPDALQAAAGPTRSRLLRSASLWLELLAALFLALWLGGLSVGAAVQAHHLVFVIDDSASMGARVDGESAIERAVRGIERLVDETPSGAVATLILTGTRPEIVVGPRAPLALLSDALERLEPARPFHDVLATLHLGAEIAGKDGRLFFFTDRETPGVPDAYEQRLVGRAAPNSAIASARRADGRIFFDLRAWWGLPVETTLTIDVAGATVHEQKVTLAPEKTTHLSVKDPGPRRAVRLRLADDALAIDNAVELLPRRRRQVSIASLLDEETGALLELEQVFAALADVRVVSDPEAARLVFSAAPGRLSPGRTEVVLRRPAADAPSDAWIGPFLIERRHALLTGLTLQGVVWTAGREPLPGLPLVLAGERALLTEEAAGGGTRLRLDLDPLRSNLATSPDWPILLSNLVEHARARLPGPVAVNVRLGELISFRNALGAEAVPTLALEDPRGDARPARGVDVLSWETRRAGPHRLKRGDETIARFSVHFADAKESDLRDAREQRIDAAREAAGEAVEGRVEAQALALLLLLCIAADWFVLARGRAA